MSKIILGVFAVMVVALGSFFVLQNYNRLPDLAAVLALEPSFINAWQKNGGIKSELAFGTRGKEVRLLQSVLLSQKEPIEVTGYFGKMTEAGIKNFQLKHNLEITGIADDSTRAKLNEFYFNELCPQENTFSYLDLKTTLVDKYHPLPKDFVPPNLVYVSHQVKSFGVICLEQETASALTRLFEAAKKEGIELAVTSGFRRTEIQGMLFNFWNNHQGDSSFDEVALPGHSEHQLGTAVDLTGKSIQNASVTMLFATSAEFEWLKKNAHLYGFVMSYPPTKEVATGYHFEPWHWRYVGERTALNVFSQNITLTEYLRNGGR